MQAPRLAQKLGTTAHLSPLLQKARRLGLDASGLEQLAIEAAFAQAVIPDLLELRDAFARAKPRVRELARNPRT